MLKEITIKMKSKEDIENTLSDIDYWGDKITCTVNPHKFPVEIMNGMIDTIAGKEIKVFPYKGHGDYKFRHWHKNENQEEGINAWYILSDWVEKIIQN